MRAYAEGVELCCGQFNKAGQCALRLGAEPFAFGALMGHPSLF
jgi:hypothetical protein